MRPSVAVRSLRDFVHEVSARGASSFDVGLYGGEPLLNGPALEAVLDEARLLRGRGSEIRVILNTNATLLDQATASLLTHAGAHIHVSLDGPDETSNRKRTNAAGRPSWPAVLKSFGILKKAGLSSQINAVLSAANITRLDELVAFAASAGCRRVFISPPDEPGATAPGLHAGALAKHLLDVRSRARRAGVDFFGPWSLASFPAGSLSSWPPPNIVVRPDGRALFPHVPRTVFDSVAQAFKNGLSPALRERWQRVVRACRGCRLFEACQGYIKMMVRYHTGSLRGSSRQCELAIAAGSMMKKERYRPLRTALGALASPSPDGEFELRSPVDPADALLVSPDVLDILDWFNRPGDMAALETSFSADNLEDTVLRLAERSLLVDPDFDTDARAFAGLVSGGRTERRGPIVIGANGKADLAVLQDLWPQLEQALTALPPGLRRPPCEFLIFGAAGPERFAEVLGRARQAPGPGWMAGTVVFSMILLNLERVRSIKAHDGRLRNQRFVRQLRHEFAHVALRKAGLRLPLWLEEGLCGRLSGAPEDPEDLRRALPEANRFVGFVKACQTAAPGTVSPAASLLEFSGASPDVNPAYILSRDFVDFCLRNTGFDGFIEAFRRAGLRAMIAPFPLADADAPLLRRPLASVLSAWRSDLRKRFPPSARSRRPLRVIAEGSRFMVYNRITGGYLTGSLSPVLNIRNFAGRNLCARDVGPLLSGSGVASSSSLSAHAEAWFGRPAGIHLRLSLNDSCNMACRYCYEVRRPSRSMTAAVAGKAVAAWRDFLLPEDIPHSTVRFFGGEPFLNWPVMEDVLGTAERGLPAGEVSWIINTNGTLFDPSWLKALRRKGPKLTVVVSCDGIGEVHDRARRLKNGDGSFHLVEAAIRKLAGAGIPVCVSAVVGRHNADGLEALARWVATLRSELPGPLSLELSPMIAHEDSLVPFSALRDRIFGALDFCRAEGLPAMCTALTRAFEELQRPGGASGHYCGIRGREISVSPDGGLLVCHAIRGSTFGRLADLEGEDRIPVPDGISGRRPVAIDGCRGCEIEGLCGGGCAAQSVWISGDPGRSPGRAFCEWMTEGFRRAARSLLFP